MRWVLERARQTLPTDIVPLPDDHHHLAADFLARAAADHPLLPYLIPIRALRTRRALATAGLALIDFAEHCGEIDVTADRLEGMAVWLTPGPPWTAAARRLRAVRLAAALGLGPDGFVRCLRAIHNLERIEHQLLPTPRRDLLLLAIQADRRERGLEELLVTPGLQRGDAERIPAATVCFLAAAVLFYVKLGFAVVEDGDLPGGGPRYWLLAREPSS